ncbi:MULTISPECIES: prolipoprotein diacylglyceryl transferase [Anaerolinea]|uniref:prolipoprotein diacylglyceryl transferase n=1 Tax=Anaerolinea TaxID=233189 RepID=UPI0026237761|nr:prolipoprotein diacylglyceryl transferase family protein [Anaerolinea thermophila]
MLPVIHIGPFAVQTPGLILLLGVWFAMDVTEKHALRFQVDPAKVYRLIVIGLISGVLGARIGYALQFPQAFLSSPLSFLSLTPQMLSVEAGILAALLVSLIYLQRAGLPFWQTLDALTTFFSILAVAIGLSHVASGEKFGIPTTLAWGVDLWGARRHPTQIYEVVVSLAILLAVWIPRKNFKASLFFEVPGGRFLLFVILTAIGQIIVETFRADSLWIGPFRQAQIIAWLILVVSLWVFGKRLRESVRISG